MPEILKRLARAVMALPWFRPIQIPREIARLCARLADMRPRTIVELGGAAGGTAYLFSGVAAPDATIVSIDLAYGAERLAAIPELAFHDVVADYFTRFGKRTHADTGGVPRFWTELRARHECEEIVENPEQDGLGIGVLRWRTPR